MKYFTLFLLLLAGIAMAEDWNLFGYYENQVFPQKIGGNFKWLDYNKIRVDLQKTISENLVLSGDVIGQTWHGWTVFSPADLLPPAVVSAAGMQPEELSARLTLQREDRLFVDNLNLTWYRGAFMLQVGKQQLPFGDGYAWNPTDIFHEKNVLDPTYEKEGVNVFRAEWNWTGETRTQAVLKIGEDWQNSTAALRFRTSLAGWSLSALGGKKWQPAYNPLQPNGGYTSAVAGGSFSGQVFGCGVWGEGAAYFREKGGDYSQWLVGMDYTLENGLYFMNEYYFNGSGKRNSSEYRLDDWMRLLSAAGENLGRRYLYSGIRYPVTELANISFYHLYNFSDKSGLLMPWWDYSLGDNSELIFAGYFPYGKALSEFGEFGWGGFARIRVYF